MLAAIIEKFPLRFFNFKTKLDANALFGTFTHRKNRYDTNASVTSATYYSQLSKRSHMQLVSWFAKTCANMARLVANTSHPVNNHYNSNPDTSWTNLIPVTQSSISSWHKIHKIMFNVRITHLLLADSCFQNPQLELQWLWKDKEKVRGLFGHGFDILREISSLNIWVEWGKELTAYIRTARRWDDFQTQDRYFRRPFIKAGP